MNDQPEQFRGDNAASGRAGHSLAPRYGRRALIIGTAAAGAGLAANVVAGGAAVAAPDSPVPDSSGPDSSAPDSSRPVLLGKLNSASGSTVVGSVHANGLEGHTHTKGASGVAGIDFSKAAGANGVYGQTYHGFGVFGIGIGGGDGVGGHSNTSGHSAVSAVDSAPGGGTALLGQSAHGLALHAEGKVKFSTRSGVAIVPAGDRTATIGVSGLTPSSKVFATIQQAQSGIHLEGAEPASESFTLTLSASPSAPMRVAWFVLE
jgi:hypothetical protein